jgi:hypothetical protein
MLAKTRETPRFHRTKPLKGDTMDKPLKKSLQQFAFTFQESKQRNINEADTVRYLTRFLPLGPWK